MLGVIGLPKPSALSIVHLNFKEVLRGWGQPCAVLGNTETQRTRRNPSSDSLFPISYFLFPIPHSPFPIPHSPFSILHSPFSILSVSLCLCVSKTTPFQPRASRQTGLTLARNPSIFVKLTGLQQPMPEGGICNPLRPIEFAVTNLRPPGS
jgi:hypothetical protein